MNVIFMVGYCDRDSLGKPAKAEIIKEEVAKLNHYSTIYGILFVR